MVVKSRTMKIGGSYIHELCVSALHGGAVHSDFSLANGLKSWQGQQNGDEESEALISDHHEASPGHSPNMP